MPVSYLSQTKIQHEPDKQSSTSSMTRFHLVGDPSCNILRVLEKDGFFYKWTISFVTQILLIILSQFAM